MCLHIYIVHASFALTSLELHIPIFEYHRCLHSHPFYMSFCCLLLEDARYR